MDKLSIYNEALEHLGQTAVASLTEVVPARYALDSAWAGSLAYVLAEGSWNWATRTVSLEYDPDVAPAFGYRFAFTKPTDWLSTTAIANDEYFKAPLREYEDEGSNWYADINPLFVRFESDDPAFGMDLSKWTRHAEMALAAHLAFRIARKIPGSRQDRNDLFDLSHKYMTGAKAKDGKNEPARSFPAGSFVRARQGWGNSSGRR